MIATQIISNGPVATVKTCEEAQMCEFEHNICSQSLNDYKQSDLKLDDQTQQERYCKVIKDLMGLLYYTVAKLPARKKAVAVDHINGWLKDLLAEGIEPNPGPLAFKYYGNYGGPGYTAGKFGGSDFSVKPIDALDSCFRTHDFFYFNGLEKTGDKILISQLNKLIPSLSGEIRQKAVIALFGFAAKYLFTKNSNKITALTNADDLYKKYNIKVKAPNQPIIKHKILEKIPATAKDFYAAVTGKGDYKSPPKRLVGIELNPGPPMSVAKQKKMLKSMGQNGKSAKLIKAAVRPRQSGFATAKKVRGKGDYISDLGSNLGSKLGGFLGGHAATLLGSIFGLGDYQHGKSVGSNSMLNGTSPPVISQSDKQRAFIFRHREYINDVLSSTTFTNTSYIINAGLFRTYPWLGPIASAFEQFKVMGMLFEYKSLTSDISPNSSGSVIMSTEYNLTKPNFVSKIQMENSEYAVSCKPTVSMLHAIECEPKEIPVNILDVRSGAVPSGQDPRFYDLGNFQIATQGQTTTQSVLGELWVTYEIAFFKPLFNTGLGLGLLTDKYRLTNAVNANLFVNTSLQPGSLIGTTLSANNTISFPTSVSTGEYLIILNIVGSNTTNTTPTFNFTNCVGLQIWSNAGGPDAVNYIGSQTSVLSTNTTVAFIVSVNAPGATYAQIQILTLALSGGNFGDLLITQINGNIVS